MARSGCAHISRYDSKVGKNRIPPPHIPYTPGIYTFLYVLNTLQKSGWGVVALEE